MSDVMLFGVLRMPYEMAMNGEIARRQFYSRAQEAANRIEILEAEVERLRAERDPRLAALDAANAQVEAAGRRRAEREERLGSAPAAGTAKDAGPAQKLQWSGQCAPDADVPYHHFLSMTPFGRILITWKGWKDDDYPTIDEHPVEGAAFAQHAGTVESAKEEAERRYFAAIGAHKAGKEPE